MGTQKYKFSMFMKTIECSNGEVLLYSSYLGIDKIIKISAKNALLLFEWINISDLFFQDDPLFLKLIDLGYIVEAEVNEKLLRQNLINETLYDKKLILVIHTTEDCNFRCEYCALDFNRRSMQSCVGENIVKFIRKNISQYESVSISWFGGEPLLNMPIIEQISRDVIEICKCAKKPYYASITTNGYLLTPKNMELLYSCNVRHITVTLDGNKETHDKQRHLIQGGNTFDKIIENLKGIRNEKRYHIKVSIRTNVTKEILSNIKSFFEYLNDEFGNDNRFGIFIRLAGDWGGERVKKIKSNLLSEDAYSQIYDILQNIPDLTLDWSVNKADFEPAGCFCQAMRKNKYTIAVDGSIHKCDTPNMPIGCLDDNGIMNINDKTICEWSLPQSIASKQCDECFFSCACFMGTCPQNMILNKNTYTCSGFLEGIESIIKWIAKTEKIDVL